MGKFVLFEMRSDAKYITICHQFFYFFFSCSFSFFFSVGAFLSSLQLWFDWIQNTSLVSWFRNVNSYMFNTPISFLLIPLKIYTYFEIVGCGCSIVCFMLLCHYDIFSTISKSWRNLFWTQITNGDSVKLNIKKPPISSTFSHFEILFNFILESNRKIMY